ncbi:MAG: peroxidase [Phormidesmis priestleyi]|uniref:Peroxidase n=1 Tax=Phormidesmis priestleyi TaxID=268141 RepID=A0A2W4X3N8_9CYAN|nr:MAG: peroxidase [Phormidesmis priestleyi]
MTRHGAMPLGGANAPSSIYHEQGRFGRIFPALPPFAADNPTLRGFLREIGKINGIMDAKDDLSDPVGLITKPALNVRNENNPDITAGFTFLGQFIDHDITFDPTSSLERQQDPETIANFRTPSLGLDNVYGSGPKASPHLYDQDVDSGLTTFLVEKIPGSEAISRDHQQRFDLPRNCQRTALIGDPRNDENLIVSQLHLAFLKFHNAVVTKVKADTGLTNPNEIFAEAQRVVRWHYQWIIVHEFLPLTVGQDLVTNILTEGRKFYKWRNLPFIPVEFAVSAYRFGHSQARPSYRANFGLAPDDSGQFIALFLDDGRATSPASDAPDPADLRGGKRAARRFIDWQTFFDFGDGRARPNKKIDTILSSALFDLPGIPGMEPQSLATRNLLRHVTFRIPSGQSVAKAMGVNVLHPTILQDLKPFALDQRTPLWFYILREAETAEFGAGKHLGPVGGRIVAEVLIGLLEGDSESYLQQDPGWIPTLPTLSADGSFKITDLLRFAEVVIPL